MLWYVARTKPGKEQHATATLVQRGIEAYLPILRKSRPRAGRRDWEPLFPGYLFARLDVPSEQWLAARSAPDVAYFLGQDGRPTPLSDGFVPTLMARLELANRKGGPPRFQPGQPVVITHGPFHSMDAIFDRSLSASGRSRVLVQLLHRQVPVDLFDEYLRDAV